jgi:ADP-heptose:LPS heptosyltransferase
MVCSPYNRVVMERNTDVDDIVELAAGERPRDLAARLPGVHTAIALAPRNRDLAVVGATRAKVRVGYTYVRRYLARLTARLYVNHLMISEADPDLCERHPHRHVRHEVDQLIDLVALAGATRRIERLRVDITEEDRTSTAYLPADPIVLHLGLRWFIDGSTLQSTVALIRELHRFGIPIVVTYAPESERYVDAISDARQADVVLGGLPFHRWAAVFERARMVVTVDTGATHVASAVRRPTVVAFEHRYFRLASQEWAPYGVPSKLIRKPGDESPASLQKFRGEILEAVSELLDA